MGKEDVVAGKIKQVKGKANDIAGAVKGDTAQQITCFPISIAVIAGVRWSPLGVQM